MAALTRFARCLRLIVVFQFLTLVQYTYAVDFKPGDILADLVLVKPDSGKQTLAGVQLADQDALAFDGSGMLLNIFGGGITTHDLVTREQSTLFPNGTTSSIVGLVVADDGRIFAYDNTSVSRIDPITGQQSILSSGGHFSQLNSIAMDTNGNVLVGDRGNKTLFSIHPDSGAREIISSGDGIFDIAGIAVDGNGDYIVLNERATAPSRFLKIDRNDKTQSNAVDGDLKDSQGITINTSLSTLADFVIDGNGDFLVAMRQPLGQSAGLFRIDPGNGLVTNLNAERFVIQDLVKNSAGEVFFTALILDGNGLYKLDQQTGEADLLIYQGVFSNNTFQSPAAADTDAVYFIQNGIKKQLPATGKIEDVASGGLLTQPQELVVEGDGNLLVLDSANKRIVRVNPETGAQSQLATVDVEFGAADMSLGYDGFLYVLPTGIVDVDHRIVKIDPATGNASLVPFTGTPRTNLAAIAIEPNGTILFVSSVGIYRMSQADGTYVLIAQRGDQGSLIDRPRDLEVAADGTIYVADSDARALIAIDPDTLQQSILSEDGYIPTSGVIRRPVELALVPGLPSASENQPPVVEIVGGDRTVPDTDNFAGESVSFTAAATDGDGTIVSTAWLINGQEAATGLILDIDLPDGETTITFKAIDDEGASSTDIVTVSIESPPLEQGWPAPYSGITPDESLGLEFNNISVLNPQDGLIYSCIRILANGVQSTFEGIDRYDIAFQIVSVPEATIGVVRAKPFNGTSALNEFGELPDCSGTIELTTNVYTDTIQAGNEVYSVRFELFDAVNLLMRGLEVSLIGTVP